MSSSSADGRPFRSFEQRGISLMGLVALVISSSIGSGVFALQSDIAAASAPAPALAAWLITGVGFIGLAATFGLLSIEKPELNGLVAYAKEGFGPFVGFISGWGYWLSIWIGNVAFSVMFISALGYFIPLFAQGLSPVTLVLNSVISWSVIWLVNRGVERASVINAVVMVCKLVPIFAFIVVMAAVFDPARFSIDLWGTRMREVVAAGQSVVPAQVVSCLMVMMWVFVGMEGASVLGHRARCRSDVSSATVLGTVALVAIYIAASILPYGFIERAEIAAAPAPSMAFIFQAAVGPWGGAFITGGLIVSILGAWLSYVMLASETLNEMAHSGLVPRLFAGQNENGAPTSCLVATGAMIQTLSVVMLFSAEAYRFASLLCTAAIVISWSLAAAYQAKLAWRGRRWGVLASAGFTCLLLVAAVLLSGVRLLMLCCIAYVPGMLLYLVARREGGAERAFRPWEAALAAGIAAVAVTAVTLLATGGIRI
ncbi:MAG: amino acid permease [Coriobacteriaceae bacterium]|nr:amino acid permease [Coriobacteriaceae bacterium]